MNKEKRRAQLFVSKFNFSILVLSHLCANVFCKARGTKQRRGKYISFYCSYARILSSYPVAVVAAVATVSVTCLIVVFTTHTVPDFSDPQLVCMFELTLVILVNVAYTRTTGNSFGYRPNGFRV